MALLALFVVALFAAGDRTACWLWRREALVARPVQELSPMCRVASATLFGFGFWVAIDWALSPLRLVACGPLLVAALVVLVATTLLAARAPRAPSVACIHPDGDRPDAAPEGGRVLRLVAVSVCLLVLGLWATYVLWRATLFGAATHDALAYHLPKAILMARAHGYELFDAADYRINGLPSDYELMMSNIILFDGSDHLTEWLGTLSWVALLVSTAALAERWAGPGLHVLGTAVAMAAVPVVLLHSGADKNDLIGAAFFLQAMLWGARWAVSGSWPSAVLTIVAVTLGFGTKPHGLFVAVAVAVPILVQAIRRRRLCNVSRPFLSVIGVALLSFALLGGASYLSNVARSGGLFGGLATQGPHDGYGQWANLLWFPPLALLAPFSSRALEVWVPWRAQWWYWPRYEIYYSHFGAVLTILVAATPILWWLDRRRLRLRAPASGGGFASPAACEGPQTRSERRLTLIMAASSLLLFLPLRYVPFGLFSGFSRYIVFVPAVLMAWAIPATFGAVQSARYRSWFQGTALLVLAGVFVATALDYGKRDSFVPFRAVTAMANHRLPARFVFFGIRAGNVVDRLAGPMDHVAVDGWMDVWTQPVFGRELMRTVTAIPPGPAPVEIPADATWVMIDRDFRKAWMGPRFENTGQWRSQLGGGLLLPEDRRVFEYCSKHPEQWRLVWGDQEGQAVFRRAMP